MKIRPVEIDELWVVADLWRDMVMEEFGQPDPDLEWWKAIHHSKLCYKQHTFTMLVAVNDDEEIVGFISGEIYPEPIDRRVYGISQVIYVKPEYRKGHVGVGLYHNLAKKFVSQGAEIISFYCKEEKIPYWNKKGYDCTMVVMSMNARNLAKAYREKK